MKKYYYQITYQTGRYSPSKQRIYYGESVADAKLFAYATLDAYEVNHIIKVTKP